MSWQQDSADRSRLTIPVGPAPETWIRLSSLALVFLFTYGYGSYELIYFLRPKSYMAIQLVLITPALALIPRGIIGRVRAPIPVLCFLAWWLLSWTWSFFPLAFTGRTMYVMTMVVTVLLLGQLMPLGYFLRSVAHAGYVSIVLVFAAIIIQPDMAFSGSPGLPTITSGLRGGFVHKNLLSPVLIITLVVVLCFEQRRFIRRGITSLVIVLTLLAQTSTGLVALAVVLIAFWMLQNYPDARRLLGRGFTVISLAMFSGVAVVSGLMIGSLLSLFGKDTTYSGRTLLWRGVVDAIEVRPITGYGWGGTFVNLAAEPTVSIVRPLGYPVFHSHNAALELMIRLGAVGLILYLWLFVSTISIGWKLVRRGHAFGSFVVLFGVLIVVFGWAEVQLVFGAWYGLLAACVVIGQRLLDETTDSTEGATPDWRRSSGAPNMWMSIKSPPSR